MISIVGLGPGNEDALTLGAIKELKSEKKIYLRTKKHPTVEYLEKNKINFTSYDYKYESCEKFEDVYKSICIDLIENEKLYKDIVYCVPGHPKVAESSVAYLIELCDSKGIEYKICPSVSFIDAIIDRLKIDPIDGLKIIDAFDIKNQNLDKRCALIITQVYNSLIASEVKLELLDYYKDDTKIIYIRAAGVENEESIREVYLYELDRQKDIDYLTSIYIPKDLENRKDFRELNDIIAKLRGENGCPWDKEQTHKTLKSCLIEESYEVVEAIDMENDEMLEEELGDVLLQVVMHCQIAKEQGYFDILDVIEGISNKMIHRHPHVFGQLEVKNQEEVLVNWDKIKNKEQGNESYTDTLKHVAKSLPSLIRASKVQKKAAKVGFDWEDVNPALEKVSEELIEVKDAIKEDNKIKIMEEIGDLIFSAVNVSRLLDIDPEDAVHYTIEKFIKRFEFIEKNALLKNKRIKDMSLKEMDDLWEQSKKK